MSKTILVTGGAGFIGHHLIHYILQTTDYAVVSLDRIDTSSNVGRLHDIVEDNLSWRKRLKIVWHDLKAPINPYVAEQIGRVDYIFHLAAGSHVDRSVKNPMGFVMDNVVGKVNLLEYARTIPDLGLFLNFSTDEVYGPAMENIIFKENDRHNPCNPYSASKSAAEHMCNAYYITYGIPLITTHTMNVYGIRQNKEKFIPLVIDRLSKGKEIFIHTDESGQIGARKYLNARDVAEAVLFLLENGQIGEKYNISSNEEVSNLELASQIAKIMNLPPNFILHNPIDTRGKNDIRYAICGQKMRDLGWTPKILLEDGLAEVVKWYRSDDRKEA